MSITDITIVITSFKSDEKIKDCLNSIDSRCKIILIENSNDLSLKKKIESEYTNVLCILTGENLGYGKANNFGISKAETDYVFILNPDAKLLKNTFTDLCNKLKY